MRLLLQFRTDWVFQREGDGKHSKVRQYKRSHNSIMFVGMGKQIEKGDNIILTAFERDSVGVCLS